jgi:hypothetical protein
LFKFLEWFNIDFVFLRMLEWINFFFVFLLMGSCGTSGWGRSREWGIHFRGLY